MIVLKSILIYLACLGASQLHAQIVTVQEATVNFISDAPLEMIKATSSELKGLIDIENHEFAFTIDISSFHGFNSPLQQVHFNENYLESDRYPTATFSGKIIEQVDLSVNGVYPVRVKGQLNVHGEERERIIRSTITVENGLIHIVAQFSVMLDEHNIRIPKIVQQKIAQIIKVDVAATYAGRRS